MSEYKGTFDEYLAEKRAERAQSTTVRDVPEHVASKWAGNRYEQGGRELEGRER